MGSLQELFCRACGKAFRIDLAALDEGCCSPACLEELGWRRKLSMDGAPYRLNPSPETCQECRGLGRVRRAFPGKTASHPCPACSRDGLALEAAPSCQSCRGDGIHVLDGAPGVCSCVVRWEDSA